MEAVLSLVFGILPVSMICHVQIMYCGLLSFLCRQDVVLYLWQMSIVEDSWSPEFTFAASRLSYNLELVLLT